MSKKSSRLDDSLPIPLMPIAHSHASSQWPNRSPRRSPHKSPHRSPDGQHSPSRFVTDKDWPRSVHHQSKPSEAMLNLEQRWKVCVAYLIVYFYDI